MLLRIDPSMLSAVGVAAKAIMAVSSVRQSVDIRFMYL